MIKKLIILLMAVVPLCVNAQQAVGSWTFYPTFSTVEKIVETPGRVYYQSAGSLFYFDKETEESGHLSATTGLNDVDVSNIFYNPNGEYVLVVYATGNMDKIYDSGKIINLPDISNAVFTETPKVIDVAFSKDCFFVLANFGLVSYDDKKNEVRATAFTKDIQSVMCMGDRVVANIDNQLRFAPVTESITNVDKLKLLPTYSGRIYKPIMLGTPEGIGYFADGQRNHFKVWKMTVDFETGTPSFAQVKNPNTGEIATAFYDMAANLDGTVSFIGRDYYLSLDKEGNPTWHAIPEAVQNQKISVAVGPKAVWAGNDDGIAEYDITSATPAVKHDRFTGSDLTVSDIGHLTMGRDGVIVASHRYYDQLFSEQPREQAFRLNIIEDGRIADITPDGGKVVENLRNGMRAVKSPNAEDTYYVASWQGLYCVQNGKFTGCFTTANAPFASSQICDIFFDSTGALWAVTAGEQGVAFLPADKQKIAPSAVKSSDWVRIPLNNHHERTTRGYGCKKSNLVLWAKAYGTTYQLTIYDTKGTASSTDDESVLIEQVYDQDNNQITEKMVAFVEDRDGNILLGTENAVLNLGIPRVKELSRTPSFTRIKIPRNDGTNLADYLADGAQVYDIAVDAANNKWLATSSGAIQVNSANDKILQQFTHDNSPLPFTTVQAVACDPNSNSVWFATKNGLVEYSSATAPGEDDYSECIAYPNPVRPEYTGMITVKGLMNDSLVKIADAAGNVIVQGRSNGGMFLWDGCNASGERVRSGVYYVFASQNASGSSSGAVTKILVVN